MGVSLERGSALWKGRWDVVLFEHVDLGLVEILSRKQGLLGARKHFSKLVADLGKLWVRVIEYIFQDPLDRAIWRSRL